MTSVLTWSEILTLLMSGLILGGSMGMIVGLIINKLNLSYKQPLAVHGLLGAVGYWAGIYIRRPMADGHRQWGSSANLSSGCLGGFSGNDVDRKRWNDGVEKRAKDNPGGIDKGTSFRPVGFDKVNSEVSINCCLQGGRYPAMTLREAAHT